jgi:hypothetical protein
MSQSLNDAMTQSPNPTPPPRRPRDPSALTSEYHKAHKQLLLWSAILFIWELIGVDLDKAKEAGGNVGAAVSILRSPQAVPWALVILVVYFFFKLTLEWNQNAEERRRNRSAQVDFGSALVIAGVSLALYAAQTVSHQQVANGVAVPSLVVGFLFPLTLSALILGLMGERFGLLWQIVASVWTLTVVSIGVFALLGNGRQSLWALLGLGLEVALVFLLRLIFRKAG